MNKKNTEADISVEPGFTLEMTQAKYDEMKARGISEEAIPAVGTHHYSRTKRIIKPEDAKVKVTLYVDGDILQHFRHRAAEPNSAPYQTQMNNELRAAMERDTQEKSGFENEMLSNEVFLRALKEKLATV